MRRALVALVVVIALVVTGFVVVPYVRSRALARQLEADVTALRARAVVHTPPVLQPIHDNGFQCFAGMLKVTPRDLSPFDKPGALDAAALQKELKALEPWADNLRACGESRELRFVAGAEPWSLSPDLLRLATALGRVTALQTRVDVEAGRAVEASLRCHATLNAAFDWTYLGLVGVQGARSLAREVAPACAAALDALPPQLRADAAQTWVTLLPRVVSLQDLLKTERATRALRVFGPFTQLHDLPPSTRPSSALQDLADRRLWSSWDAAFQALLDAPDAATRSAAAERLCAHSTSWAPDALCVNEGLVERSLQDVTTLSLALTWLASGAGGKPPVGERTDAGLVLPMDPPLTLPLHP